MSKFVVDVEADGPCPGPYSMVSFGVVMLEDPNKTYYSGVLRNISSVHIPEALAISGHTREEQESGRNPRGVMTEFLDWINEHNQNGRPMFFSDNNGFDWQFINYYFHVYQNGNPFGHSSTNINSLYKGMCKDMRKNIKRLRKTKHTHHPVDDAKGNVEALVAMQEMGLK